MVSGKKDRPLSPSTSWYPSEEQAPHRVSVDGSRTYREPEIPHIVSVNWLGPFCLIVGRK